MTQTDMFAAPGEVPDVDVPATVAIAAEVAPEFGAGATKWAAAQLEDIAESTNTRTRLKTVKSDPNVYQGLLQACCVVALSKAQAYARACAGDATAPLKDWVVSQPLLARACLALDRAGSTVSLVEMLPAGFAQQTATVV